MHIDDFALELTQNSLTKLNKFVSSFIHDIVSLGSSFPSLLLVVDH